MLVFFKDYASLDSVGWIRIVWEILIIILVIATLLGLLIKHVRSKIVLISYIVSIVILIVSMLLDSMVGVIAMTFLLALLSFMVILYYLPEYKKLFTQKNIGKPSKEFLSNQEVKNELIETLIKAVDHLASRKIGAIITIEREHTLNTLVEGSVKLDALVTFELLETIFHPNTALHDGAVIIRGDRIKCASAFYTPSTKKDIPQHYGSRHRAAIGISEQSDAFTIVVSEETGHIATTVDGTITGNISLESLRNSLNQQIIVR